jgi:hypothetical protein
MGNEKHRKPYERPTVIRMTPEEAKLKLVEHARKGDQEAIHLLEIMFPEEAKRVSENTKKIALRPHANVSSMVTTNHTAACLRVVRGKVGC